MSAPTELRSGLLWCYCARSSSRDYFLQLWALHRMLKGPTLVFCANKRSREGVAANYTIPYYTIPRKVYPHHRSCDSYSLVSLHHGSIDSSGNSRGGGCSLLVIRMFHIFATDSASIEKWPEWPHYSMYVYSRVVWKVSDLTMIRDIFS